MALAEGPFEAKYNLVMNQLEKKLKTDARLKAIQPQINVYRGAPTSEPTTFPSMYMAEGRITDVVWDTFNAVLTVTFTLEVYIQSRDRENGIKEIRTKCLKVFDTLVGSIDDRRLSVDGISLANGDNGVKVVDCDFGYFAPSDNTFIYKGIIDVEVSVEVPLT